MANTYASIASGRLPGVNAATKVPGPPLKVKLCKLVYGDIYPDGGITAAALETGWGFTRIESVVPCGGMILSTGIWPFSWDGVARKLQIFAAPDYTGAAMTVGTIAGAYELADNDATPTDAVGYCLVFGY
jgi:hypothetical protein